MVIEDYFPFIKYQGIKTNVAVDLSGSSLLTLPSNASLIATTAPVIAGGLTASGSASNDFSGSTGTFKFPSGASIGQVSTVTNVTGSTLAPAAAASGTIYTLNRAAGITVTLPTPVVGLVYRFIVGTTNTGTLKFITDAGTTLLVGSIVSATTTASVFNSVAATSNIAVSMNGTTTGGIVGTDLTFVCISATAWQVSGVNFTSSTTATPFATS